MISAECDETPETIFEYYLKQQEESKRLGKIVSSPLEWKVSPQSRPRKNAVNRSGEVRRIRSGESIVAAHDQP